MHKITVGGWRTAEDDPMRVVSGPIGKEKVHFSCPKKRVIQELLVIFQKMKETITSKEFTLHLVTLLHVMFLLVRQSMQLMKDVVLEKPVLQFT